MYGRPEDASLFGPIKAKAMDCPPVKHVARLGLSFHRYCVPKIAAVWSTKIEANHSTDTEWNGWRDRTASHATTNLGTARYGSSRSRESPTIVTTSDARRLCHAVDLATYHSGGCSISSIAS